MKLLAKILFTTPIALFLLVMFLVGINQIIDDIQSGKFPMQDIAVAFGVPNWLSLVLTFIIIAIAWRIIIYPIIRDRIINPNKNKSEGNHD